MTGFLIRPRALALLAALLAFSLGSQAAEKDVLKEEADVVSLDEARPSPSATASPTFSATPTEVPPTAVPTAQPAKAGAEAMAPAPKENLADPGFDKPRPTPSGNEDDGLVIIAPGAASPEDSLEAFGIDTPFNWREKKKRAIAEPGEGGAQAGNESIELNAPETSDLKDQVSVEEPGKPATEAENYDAVERAGFILPLEEFRFDAMVVREKNGHLIFGKGDLVYLQMQPGRQVYPGSIYTAFRDEGKVMGGEDRKELGDLVRGVSVIRVIRVDSENIMARVDRQYDHGKVGDGLRLRDPDRARHFASLRQNAGEAPAADLKGEIAELQNRKLTIRAGQHAYLTIGRSQGVLAGMKLMIYRDVPLEQDTTKIQPGPVGKIGEFVVVSTQKNSCTVRLNKAVTAVRVGDKVRYR